MPKLFRDRTLPALCPFCRAEIGGRPKWRAINGTILPPRFAPAGRSLPTTLPPGTAGRSFCRPCSWPATATWTGPWEWPRGWIMTLTTSKNTAANCTAWNPMLSGPSTSFACGPGRGVIWSNGGGRPPAPWSGEKNVDSPKGRIIGLNQSYARREPPRLNWAAFFISVDL